MTSLGVGDLSGFFSKITRYNDALSERVFGVINAQLVVDRLPLEIPWIVMCFRRISRI